MLFSCEREEYDSRAITYTYCKDNMEFSCDKLDSDPFYFECKLNDVDFCISAASGPTEEFAYYMRSGIGTSSRTPASNPVLSANTPVGATFFALSINPPQIDVNNGLSEDFAPAVSLWTPFVPGDSIYPGRHYIERFFQVGELPLRSPTVGETEGFKFDIYWACVRNPISEYRLRTGGQILTEGVALIPSVDAGHNVKLELLDIQSRDFSTTTQYFMTFKIEGDFVYSGAYNGRGAGDWAGKITDGIFKAMAEVPR